MNYTTVNAKIEKHDVALILNSAQASSGSNATGTANYILSQPLRFEMSEPRLALASFSFTNYFLNISAALGNNTIYYSDDTGDSTKYSITISDGSWSISSLNSFIVNALVEAGTAPGLFELLPDYSQNKVYVKWSDTLVDWYLSFEAGTPYTLLGFDLNDFVPADKTNSVNEINYAPNNAAFNNVEAVNVKTNLSNNMILGTDHSNVIYQTTPTASIGSVQRDEPTNLLWANANSLAGGISEIKVSITDQNDNALPMSENFTVVLRIQH